MLSFCEHLQKFVSQQLTSQIEIEIEFAKRKTGS